MGAVSRHHCLNYPYERKFFYLKRQMNRYGDHSKWQWLRNPNGGADDDEGRSVLETVVLYLMKGVRRTGYLLDSVKRQSSHLSQC